MGLLIGTDFNEGVKGIGPKKALALVKKHGSLEPALEELGVEIESKDEVREIFLHPKVIEVAGVEFNDPDKDGVRRMLCDDRSEEHTSELQSLAYLVCRLLLEKKKKNKK